MKPFFTDTEDCIIKGFQKTTESFQKLASNNDLQSGCTATLLFVFEDHYYISNVGDSESILCRDDSEEPIILTCKHTPDLESEKRRIEQNGGAVIFYGTYRINGLLAVSRSIGDNHLKNLIISLPSIKKEKRSPQDNFIIIASDGLWDVIKKKDCMNLVINYLKSYPKKEIPRLLIDEALNRNSNDNISILIMFFR